MSREIVLHWVAHMNVLDGTKFGVGQGFCGCHIAGTADGVVRSVRVVPVFELLAGCYLHDAPFELAEREGVLNVTGGARQVCIIQLYFRSFFVRRGSTPRCTGVG